MRCVTNWGAWSPVTRKPPIISALNKPPSSFPLCEGSSLRRNVIGDPMGQARPELRFRIEHKDREALCGAWGHVPSKRWRNVITPTFPPGVSLRDVLLIQIAA